nr:acyl-CoA/acyl-ACP dehydrogenase [Deinococcota bacterium]
GKLPAEDVQALKDSGYLSLSVPRDYGGGGLSLRECVEAQLELAKGSTATALLAAMPLHIFGHAREVAPWPEEMFARLCELAVGGALFNSAASEPQLGSPSRGGLPQTEAKEEVGGYLISGHKTWTTGGRHLTHLLVQVRLAGEPAVMLVENHAPGVRWVETWGDTLSLRASDSHDVYFEEVRVPAANLVQRGKRASAPNAWFPMMVSAVYLGTAVAARDAVIGYALERVPTALGKPIATLPKVERQVGDIEVALAAARTLLLRAAAEWQDGQGEREVCYSRVVAAKHLATETAIAVTEKALRIAGGASVSKSLPLERHFRDARAGLMHPPAGDTALELVGRHAVETFPKGDPH